MAQYPGAIKMLIPEGDLAGGDDQPRIVPIGIILHTNAANRSIEWIASQYKNSNGEAHFQLETSFPTATSGGNVSGRLAQYVDTEIRADNNYRANSFVKNGVLCGYISIETGDLGNAGDPSYLKNWTQLGQRAKLEDLLVWLCRTHGIPPNRPADPTSPGIGYHAMWGYNNRLPGNGTYGRFTAEDGSTGRLNNPWTNTYGKICPGPSPGVAGGKIGEFDNLLAAVALRVLVGDDVAATVQDALLFWGNDPQVKAARDAALSSWMIPAVGSFSQAQQFGSAASIAFAQITQTVQFLGDGHTKNAGGDNLISAFSTFNQVKAIADAIETLADSGSPETAAIVAAVITAMESVTRRTTATTTIASVPGQLTLDFDVEPAA